MALNETKLDDQPPRPLDEPPPFGQTWRTLYAIVIVNLIILTTLFYIFTRAFS